MFCLNNLLVIEGCRGLQGVCFFLFFEKRILQGRQHSQPEGSGPVSLNACASTVNAFMVTREATRARLGNAQTQVCKQVCKHTHSHPGKGKKKTRAGFGHTHGDAHAETASRSRREAQTGHRDSPVKHRLGAVAGETEPKRSESPAGWQAFLCYCISSQRTVFQGTAVLKCKDNRQEG